MTRLKFGTLIASILMAFFSLSEVQASVGLLDALKTLPVQEGGRVKPFDTFAREMLFLLHGKDKMCSPVDKSCRPAHEVVFTILLQPEMWQNQAFIEIKRDQLKEALKLPLDKKHFSPAEILSSPRLSLVFQELNAKREAKEKLDPYFQAVQRLENQLFTLRELSTGRLFRLLPPQQSPPQGDAWIAVTDFDEAAQKTFLGVTQAFMSGIAVYTDASASRETQHETSVRFSDAVDQFAAHAGAQNPALYPSEFQRNLEIHYNKLRPFLWAWIIYLVAFALLLLSWVMSKKIFFQAGLVASLLGFLLHSYGFFLRVYLTGRPPVSNMYETVVWVSWGVLVFAMIIFAMYRFRLVPLAGTAVATLCLILADAAPSILDPTLQPLEPVLRSNFWLTTHVLTITISYSAFFLALGIGNAALIYYLRGEEKHRNVIVACANSIYRAVQIGVVLLAAGIILGGIWADYSWGRFWGWDPKETWALIALLGYLAVLHGRLGGWLRDFGLIVSAIAAFSLVVMAWYGVNYVLGAGLHSYGFGAGGVEIVGGVIAIQWMLVAFVGVIRQGRLKTLA